MMNIQNPSFSQHPHLPPQHPYGHANLVAQPDPMAHFPTDFSQSQFQQPAQSQNAGQRPGQFPPQFQGQVPPQLYQKLQQHQHQQHQQHQQLQQLQQQQQQQLHPQSGTVIRPQSRENLLNTGGQAQRQAPNNFHNRSQSTVSQGNVPNTPSRQTSGPTQQNLNQQSPMAAQTMQGSNASQATRTSIQQTSAPMSPQAVAREEERVTILLEINAHLIQEVTSLQAQGKAGSGGQASPTSPTLGNNAGTNSPSDGPKRQPPSPEYADCMRRLQANLAYLAAIADANKKASTTRPAAPAIIYPPQHLNSVHPLYHKLNVLFPDASQSTLNKAMAVANAQAARTAGTPSA